MKDYPKSIFITGASSGLGRALAIAFAHPETTLFLCGRSERGLKETQKKCLQKKAQVFLFSFDITDEHKTQKAIHQAYQIKQLDLIIANAGVSDGSLGIGHKTTSVRTLFQVNIGGVINTVLPIIPLFQKKKKGHIVLISSIAGYRGLPNCPAYSASKVFVKAWGEALYGALADKNISVSVVCPGFIKTPLTQANPFYMPFLMPPEKAANIIKKGVLKKKGLIAFPWQMRLGAWLGSILPACLIYPVLKNLPHKEKINRGD